MRRFDNYYLDLHVFSADYGLVDELSRNLSTGGSTVNSYDRRSQLGEHFSVFWYLLSLPYLTGAGLHAYLVTKGAAIAISALPVYWLARRWLRCGMAAGALTTAFLLYPPTIYPLTTSFNIELFAIPTFLFALYFLERQRWGAMLLFLATAASIKENYLLTAAAYGLFLCGRGRWRLGAGIALSAIAAFCVIVLYIIPAFNPLPVFPSAIELYAHFGDSTTAIARTLLLRPDRVLAHLLQAMRLDFFAALLLPLLLLPLVAPRYLLLVLPVFLVIHLSNNPAHRDYTLFYHTECIPVLWVATIAGLRRLNTVMHIAGHPPAAAISLLLCLVAAGYWLFLYDDARLPVQLRLWPPANSDAPLLDHTRTLIPVDATIEAARGLCLHLPPGQRDYYPPHKLPPGPEYLLFYIDPLTRATPDALIILKHIAALTGEHGYGVRLASSWVYLLQRGVPVPAGFAAHLDTALARVWSGQLGRPIAERHRPFIISAEFYPRQPWQRTPLRYGPGRGLDIDVIAASMPPQFSLTRFTGALNDASFAHSFFLPVEDGEHTRAIFLPDSNAVPGINDLYLRAETADGAVLTAQFPVLIDTAPPTVTLRRVAAAAGDPLRLDVAIDDAHSTVIWWYAVNDPDDSRHRAAFSGLLGNNYARRTYACTLTLTEPVATVDTVYVVAVDACGNQAQQELVLR